MRISEREAQQVEQANTSGRTPVVFDSGWREVAQTALDFVRRFA